MRGSRPSSLGSRSECQARHGMDNHLRSPVAGPGVLSTVASISLYGVAIAHGVSPLRGVRQTSPRFEGAVRERASLTSVKPREPIAPSPRP